MTLEERLVLDNQLLKQEGFSQFQIYVGQTPGTYYLWGEHRTNAGNLYQIRGPIPNEYPYSKPPIYVQYPNPLLGFGYGKTINSYGVSHNMHTFSNGPDGEVQICHWNSDRWHSGITLNRVMLKVVLWLEAYEQHLATGKDICDFVRTMSSQT